MANVFRPGARVRILFSIHYPELAGQEGTILREEDATNIPEASTGLRYFAVEPDSWGGEECPYSTPDAMYFGPSENQLTPLAPDGFKVVSWGECVWQPDRISASERTAKRRGRPRKAETA